MSTPTTPTTRTRTGGAHRPRVARHRARRDPRRTALLVALFALLALLGALVAATVLPEPAQAAATSYATDAPPATDTTIDAVIGTPAPLPATTNPEPYWAEPAEDGPTATPLDDTTDVIEEDDPRWDCSTMGNKQCGAEVIDPTTGHPMPVVITYVNGVADSIRLR